MLKLLFGTVVALVILGLALAVSYVLTTQFPMLMSIAFVAAVTISVLKGKRGLRR